MPKTGWISVYISPRMCGVLFSDGSLRTALPHDWWQEKIICHCLASGSSSKTMCLLKEEKYFDKICGRLSAQTQKSCCWLLMCAWERPWQPLKDLFSATEMTIWPAQLSLLSLHALHLFSVMSRESHFFFQISSTFVGALTNCIYGFFPVSPQPIWPCHFFERCLCSAGRIDTGPWSYGPSRAIWTARHFPWCNVLNWKLSQW